MVSYEAAKAAALKLRSDVNNCMEYTDAFVFSRSNDISIGGNGPVVILKVDGRATNMVDYTEASHGHFVRSYPDISNDPFFKHESECNGIDAWTSNGYGLTVDEQSVKDAATPDRDADKPE